MALLQESVLRVQQAASIVAIRGVLVHVISEEARAFYEHHGFIRFLTNPLTLILSIAAGKHRDAEDAFVQLVRLAQQVGNWRQRSSARVQVGVNSHVRRYMAKCRLVESVEKAFSKAPVFDGLVVDRWSIADSADDPSCLGWRIPDRLFQRFLPGLEKRVCEGLFRSADDHFGLGRLCGVLRHGERRLRGNDVGGDFIVEARPASTCGHARLLEAPGRQCKRVCRQDRSQRTCRRTH